MLKVKRFTATWCGPCKVLAPVFSQLEQEMPNMQFETIDVDQNKEMVSEYLVSSVPTVVLEKDGQQVYRFTGVLPKPTIVGIIEKHL